MPKNTRLRGRLRITLIAISVCFGTGVVIATYSFKRKARGTGEDSSPAIAVVADTTRSAFLASELPHLRDILTWKFYVTNKSFAPLRFSLESPSCGCLSFDRDGQVQAVSEPWVITPGGKSSVDLHMRRPIAPVSQSQSFNLIARDEQLGDVKFSERLNATLRVFNDLVVRPASLHFVYDGESTTPRTLSLTIETHTAMIAPSVPLTLAYSKELTHLLETKVEPGTDVKEVSPRIWRTHYAVRITPKEQGLLPRDLDGRTYSLNVSMDKPDHSGKVEVSVPITFEDAQRLDSVGSLDFGSITLGDTVSRSLVIRTRDQGELSIEKTEVQDGEGVSAVISQNRPSTFALLTATFVGNDVGHHEGKIGISPAGSRYKHHVVSYRVRVLPK